MLRRSSCSAVSSTASAAVFSSTRATRRVPGIGAMSSPRVRIQASAVCAGVAPISAPMARTSSTMRRLRWKFSPVNRGLVLRQSSSAEVVDGADLPGQEAVAERASRGRSRCRARAAAAGSRPRRRGSTASTRSAARQPGARRAPGGSSRGRPRRVRSGAPCPRRPARPPRRRSPRWACSGRRGAGSTGRCGRCPAAAGSLRPRSSRSPGCCRSRRVRRRSGRRGRTSSRSPPGRGGP